MPRDYFWQGEPFTSVIVGCGLCDRRRGFEGLGSDGGIRAARRQGWRVEFRPKALIRCPEHAGLQSSEAQPLSPSEASTGNLPPAEPLDHLSSEGSRESGE